MFTPLHDKLENLNVESEWGHVFTGLCIFMYGLCRWSNLFANFAVTKEIGELGSEL